jgi:hypothetical protein
VLFETGGFHSHWESAHYPLTSPSPMSTTFALTSRAAPRNTFRGLRSN